MSKRMWMCRSRAGQEYEEFQQKGLVAIGYNNIGKIGAEETARKVVQRLAPGPIDRSLLSNASQVVRFIREIKSGDHVVTYSPSLRRYLVGQFDGDWVYDAEIMGAELSNIRKVTWKGEVPREVLSAGTRNSLGSVLTVFVVPDEGAKEILSKLGSPVVTNVIDQTMIDAEVVEERLLYREAENKALEFTKDQVNRLSWQEMQELVAGLLRALNYKTRISPAGPDQGKDIVASPDGFGFQQPRIVVEVKHRAGAMGAREIRSFLGGRHKDDRGLYVSTGGFSKDARYEAERASIPLTLLDLEGLVTAIIDNYDQLDAESKRLIPLKRLYWPA